MIEPQNTKALNRKGLAFLGKEMWTEAYDTFEKVLQLEPENKIAQQELIKLHHRKPSKTAVRMKIEEIEEIIEPEQKKIIRKSSEKLEIPESSHIPTIARNIVPTEATPFDKLMPKKEQQQQPREKLLTPSDAQQQKKSSSSSSRILIQEIN
jgi:hypothetical protein